MEFAVIQTGGKQYKVAEGDVITIERVNGLKQGEKVVFDKVLMVDNGTDTTIGTPYINEASVEGEIIEEGKGKKLVVMKYKAKSNRIKKNGHRQLFMKVRIGKIK